MNLFSAAASLDHVGMILLRGGLVIVLLWIGALKFADYEAESIVPMVTNNPLLRYFYRFRAPEYRKHLSPEGHLKPLDHQWNVLNRTYLFSRMLGCMIIAIGSLIGLEFTSPRAAAAGSVLLALMSLTTLSFLVTTPEAWIRQEGNWNFEFPFLSGMGRLIVKDCIMLGAAIVTLADSAKVALR